MSTVTTTAPWRPGLRALATLVRAEARMVARDTAGLVLPLTMPVLILVMNGAAASGEELPGAGGLTPFDVYVVPIVFAVVMGTIGVINMPSFLAAYRRSGVLKRLSATPLRPSSILVAQVTVSAAQTIVGLAIAWVVAVFGFGAQLPRSAWLAAGVLVLAAAAMYGLGAIVAAVAPTPNSSVAIGLVTFFAIGATGGMFGGVASLPEPIARVGEYLPFGAATSALEAVWLGDSPNVAGLLALAAWALGGLAVGARVFRW
ncbi:ABC transporter permease [Rhodococcus rhodnii]|uniref:ABC-2 type transporter transmembrane domain-containing protein n=2 Tax=Rhodococcus rhodnii TaxID=38312 RepID=R7WLX9_9NOCA|nr:ABC transporter permease [Rhodococcus rhodnii]EOM76311.1 hypothetical protein Rrhod_2312 [Rhodococcus rhodnii LMG 5362]TXG89986.1 ABC transporter permease [Rhodococcus rhodnii]